MTGPSRRCSFVAPITGRARDDAGSTTEGRDEGGAGAPPPARGGSAAPLTLAVVLFVMERAPANDRGAAAVVHALMVALPAAVALAALARNPTTASRGRSW